MTEQEPRKLETEEEAQVAAEKVLYPDLLMRKVKLLEHEVEVKPLPVAVSKQVHQKLKAVQERCYQHIERVQKQAKEGTLNSVIPPPDDTDVLVAEALLEVAKILAKHYKIPVTPEEVNDNASLQELDAFIKVQVEVNGESDFLLRPLSFIMKSIGMMPKAEDMMKLMAIPTSLPLARFVKPGE